MSPTHRALRIASVIAAALLAAGCAIGSTASVDPAADGSETFDATPSPEPTGSEEPLPPVEDASIAVPTLPVGGNTDVDGVAQCAHANWLGAPIPPGVEVTIDQVTLDQAGVFELTGEACGSGGPACAGGWTWTTDTQNDECTVAATQLVDSDQSVTLVLVGTATCSSEPVCEEFESSEGLFDGSQLGFTAELGLVTTESSTESPTDSPTESATSESTGG